MLCYVMLCYVMLCVQDHKRAHKYKASPLFPAHNNSSSSETTSMEETRCYYSLSSHRLVGCSSNNNHLESHLHTYTQFWQFSHTITDNTNNVGSHHSILSVLYLINCMVAICAIFDISCSNIVLVFISVAYVIYLWQQVFVISCSNLFLVLPNLIYLWQSWE